MAPSSDDIDIFQAVKQESMTMLTEVIKKHKVSVTVTDKDGATPLMYAARKGNVKVIRYMYFRSFFSNASAILCYIGMSNVA